MCDPLYLKTQADKPACLPWPAVDTSQLTRDSSTEGQSRFSCVHLDSEQLSRFNEYPAMTSGEEPVSETAVYVKGRFLTLASAGSGRQTSQET